MLNNLTIIGMKQHLEQNCGTERPKNVGRKKKTLDSFENVHWMQL